jgi:murein DD-endopeptidase MepM/ murein hydrolase activator NlpD
MPVDRSGAPGVWSYGFGKTRTTSQGAVIPIEKRTPFETGASPEQAERPALLFKPRRRAHRHRPLLHGVVFGLISLSVFLSYHFSQGLAFHDQQASALVGLSLPSVQPAPSAYAASVLTSSALPETVHGQVLAGATYDVPEASAQLTAATPAPKLPFQLYSVADGDTASAIASRYGIQLEYLLAANADLRDGELLNVGQMLIIPSSNGILYHVGYGETLSDVAAEFGVTLQDIIGWGGNGIASPDQVADGQLVFVPNGTLPVAAVAEPTAEPPVSVSASVGAPPVAAADNSPPPSGPSSNHGLIWPVTGPISSYMGPSHPLGIDIDLFSTPYTDVHAATSGTVIFAGGDACCSYGYYVKILSSDGIETLYAHFSSIAVTTGQVVNQGDVLGVSGCTGNCTGNHLHFEVIDNGVRVDPLSYLP